MQRSVLPGLRTTFLAHFIVGAIVGLAYLLVPEFTAGISGTTVKDPIMWRMLGAAICGFAASSWWAWHETDWERVKIIVEMELVWTILGTVVGVWGMLTLGLPTLMWLNPILLALFAIAFGYFYVGEGAASMQPARR